MRWWSKLRLRLRSLFQSDAVDRELATELRFHLEEQIAEHLTAGLRPDEARRAALRELGSLTQIEEECRDARRVGLAETMWRDLHFGARLLAKNPAFTAIAVVTLAVGIGFNTLAFSISRSLLSAALPVQDPDRLILGEAVREGSVGGTSLLEFAAPRSETEVLSSS